MLQITKERVINHILKENAETSKHTRIKCMKCYKNTLTILERVVGKKNAMYIMGGQNMYGGAKAVSVKGKGIKWTILNKYLYIILLYIQTKSNISH